jgi:hypothetical protein
MNPMHVAAKFGTWKILDLLYLSGMNVFTRNSLFKTMKQSAKETMIMAKYTLKLETAYIKKRFKTNQDEGKLENAFLRTSGRGYTTFGEDYRAWRDEKLP